MRNRVFSIILVLGCFFYVGERGKLFIENSGNGWLTVTFGMNGWFKQTVAPGSLERIGWDDEPAVATDSAGNTICSFDPSGRG